MKIDVSVKLKRKLKKIKKKDSKLYFRFKLRIKLLEKDVGNPKLKVHKLDGYGEGIWSFSITSKIRVLFMFAGKGILLTDLGSHDEVY